MQEAAEEFPDGVAEKLQLWNAPNPEIVCADMRNGMGVRVSLAFWRSRRGSEEPGCRFEKQILSGWSRTDLGQLRHDWSHAL